MESNLPSLRNDIMKNCSLLNPLDSTIANRPQKSLFSFPISFHGLVFPNPKEILDEDNLRSLREMGYSGVEIIPEPFSSKDLDKIKRVCDTCGLTFLVGWSLGPEHHLADGDPDVVAAGIARMKELIDLCCRYESPILAGLNFAGVGKLTGRPASSREWSTAVAAYRDICAYADKRSGPMVCLEPATREDSYIINTAAQGLAFLNEVDAPNGALLLDTFQMLREEDSVGSGIAAAGNRIGYIHISESHRGTPGTGTVPWKEVAESLNKVGYAGWLGVEAFFDTNSWVASRAKVWRQMETDTLTLARRAIDHIHTMWPT